MPETPWPKVRELFERALDLPRAERDALLRTAEPELAREVRALLASDGEHDAFLEPPLRTGTDDLSGTRIGAFRVERLLAHGGMGDVWVAEQDDPRRRVALKTMRWGAASERRRRRFHFEAELLAGLQHPAIAQVFDAGVVEAGGGRPSMPWFALEYVEGARTLVDYVQQHALPLEARLELVREVCGAVQHAHQRGVIHRDLKSQNLLVDREGRVKVIDFGVARLASSFGSIAAAGGDATRPGELVGTLSAMSPEQVRGASTEIDARSDVWALGVSLYELATGVPPFDLAGLELGAASRVILEEQPRPPSAVSPRLPPEIDWIVARCMAKEAGERYPSADALAADLARLLEGRPVLAGNAGGLYRVRKFAGRYSFAVAAGVLALLALVAAVVGTSYGLVQARRAQVRAVDAEAQSRAEAEKASALSRFLLESFSAPDPAEHGPERTMLDFLHDSARRLEGSFPDAPLVRAELYRTIGRALTGLAEDTRACQHLVTSLAALDEAEGGGADVCVARVLTLADLSTAEGRLGLLDDARTTLERAQEELDGCAAADEVTRSTLLIARGGLELAHGDLIAAEADLRDALRVCGGSVDALGPNTLFLANALGSVFQRQGRFAEAQDIFASAVEAAAVGQREQPVVLTLRHNQAMLLWQQGDAKRAIAALEEVLASRERVLGAGHEGSVTTRNNLAGLHYVEGRPEAAVALWRASLAELVGREAEGNPVLQTVRINLGVWELEQGDVERAYELLTPIHAARLESFTQDDERTLLAAYELARAARRTDRTDQAIELLEGAREGFLAHHSALHNVLPRVEVELARAYRASGDPDSALMLLDELIEAYGAGERSTHFVDADQVEEARSALLDGL